MDEGTLHALLDGALRAESPERASEVEAHLAACADCRARLEAAEELRGEASGILDAASAEGIVAVPDFSDVVRRAEARPAAAGTSGRRHRQARWTRGVAWAASLVLALGTGYLIRDLAGPTVDDVPSRAIGSDAVEVESESRPALGSEPADDPAGPDLRSSDQEPQADVQDRSAPREQAPREQAPREEVGEQTAAEPATAEPTAPPAPRPAPVGAADAAATDPPADGAESARAAETLRAGARLSSAFEGSGQQWSAVTVEEARAVLDGQFYLLPRAELLNIYALADSTQDRVLSLQRLQTGAQVQVLQWRGTDEEPAVAAERMELSKSASLAAPARDEALPYAALPGANMVRVVRDEFVLELTGSLPAALLSVLGETAAPAR